MKLATLKKGGRDGTLVVVNRAMTHFRAPTSGQTVQRMSTMWNWCVVHAALNCRQSFGPTR